MPSDVFSLGFTFESLKELGVRQVAYVVVVTTHVMSLDGDAIKPNRCINCVDSQIICNNEFVPLDQNMSITSPS